MNKPRDGEPERDGYRDYADPIGYCVQRKVYAEERERGFVECSKPNECASRAYLTNVDERDYKRVRDEQREQRSRYDKVPFRFHNFLLCGKTRRNDYRSKSADKSRRFSSQTEKTRDTFRIAGSFLRFLALICADFNYKHDFQRVQHEGQRGGVRLPGEREKQYRRGVERDGSGVHYQR